jgi:alkylhydroperoxidase family enzyme
MLKWLLRRRIAAFERHYEYDMSYARDLLAADARAVLAIARVLPLSRYRRDLPADVYFAAKVTAAVAEDCGPCAQLVVAMGLEAGVPAATLAALVGGQEALLDEPVRLAAQFARAVLAREPAADELREALAGRFGARGVISLAFAITSARFYPTLKYALGHGASCQRVVVAGKPISVGRQADASSAPRHAAAIAPS